MAQQQHSIDDRGDAASALLCFSRGCTHASLRGSRCGSSVDSDWPCVFSVPSLPQTQTLLDTTLQGVTNDFTSQQSLDPATLTADPPVQSSLIASTKGKIETPPGQCKESFDRCLERQDAADQVEAKFFQAARWCYWIATETHLDWEAFRGMKNSKKLFDSIRLKDGLKGEDRSFMRAYWVKWKSWFIYRCHNCCVTAMWAVEYKAPYEDSNRKDLAEAYSKIEHLESHFITQTPGPDSSAISMQDTINDVADSRYQGFTISSGLALRPFDEGFSGVTEIAQSVGLADHCQQNIPGKCSHSLATCQQNWQAIKPEHFAAAQYFYQLVYGHRRELDWNFFRCNLTKYRSCKSILQDKNRNVRMSSVTAFMVKVRIKIQSIHQGCPTLRWAQRLEDAKVIRNIKSETTLADAYDQIKGLLEDRTKSVSLL
jgi:hypothetical protein